MTLPPRIRATIQAVADEAGVSVDCIMSRSRLRKVADARKAAMIACRNLSPQPSFHRIGEWFGRDHSSVVYACRKGT